MGTRKTNIKQFTLEELDRVKSRIRPFPLAPDVAPVGRCNFTEIPTHVLLNTPAHLIVHLQRTAAQGGMQVISPRQTPMSCLMSRISDNKRHLGDHIVGSVADIDDSWPTLDNADFSELLPDEPLPQKSVEPVIRQRTRTHALTSATHMLADPILACLVKGRAVADVLNRGDVQGDGDAVLSLLADAWGVDVRSLHDLDAFSLGYDGELLRHAIRVDDVYPTMHAPVHQRLCISVGSNEVSRDTLPADSAMDWRRMRVFCEAVFSMCCSVEGRSLREMRAMPPPGDMSSPSSRPGVMGFMPAACSAWCHSPETFSVTPVIDRRLRRQRAIPEEVLLALTRYVGTVKPMSYAMAQGFKPSAKTTHLKEAAIPDDETIQSSYHLVARATTTHGARGRTAPAAARSYIFEVIHAMPVADALRINRYIQIARAEVQVHLGLMDVPDVMIDQLAQKFLRMGEKIRQKIAAEATMRGHTIEEWWGDITSQTSARYKAMKEGTMGWAKVAMYMLFKQPTDKWRKLCSAINYQSVMDAAVRSVGAMALPPEKESSARVEAAARHVAKSVGIAYSAHYFGVYDVGMAIADYLEATGKERNAEIIKQAAYLWMLRGRVFRAINVTLVPADTVRTDMNHYLAKGESVAINLAPAPYRMYHGYRIGLAKSTVISKRVKDSLPDSFQGRVSALFYRVPAPMVACKSSDLTKYLLNPAQLGADMETAWQRLVGDMENVIAVYGAQPEPEIELEPEVVEISRSPVVLFQMPEPRTGGKKGYFETIGNLEGETMDYVDGLIADIGEEMEAQVIEEEFASAKELINRLLGIKAEQAAASTANVESVR